MPQSLDSALLKAPREKDGARTLSRYGFQIHASILKILQLHSEGSNFLALFDHFDDLVVVKLSEQCPDVESYQIKGKAAGNWTCSAIAKCEAKDKNNAQSSIIGKMFQLTEIFESAIQKTTFLTNAAFNFKLKGGGKSSVDDTYLDYSDLHQEETAKLSETLSLSFPMPRFPSEEDIVAFEITDTPVKNYDVSLKGHLVNILSNDSTSSVTALYNTLVTEVLHKSRNTTSPTSISDLYELKALTSDKLSEVLASAEAHTSILDCWDDVSKELESNGLAPTDRIRLKTAVANYLSQRANGLKLAGEISKHVSNKSGEQQAVSSLFASAESLRGSLPEEVCSDHDQLTIQAACLVTSFEQL